MASWKAARRGVGRGHRGRLRAGARAATAASTARPPSATMQHVVEVRAVRAARADDRADPRGDPPQAGMPVDQLAHEVLADGVHPGDVAADGRDLAVVGERPEGLRPAPGGGGVRASSGCGRARSARRNARRAGRGRARATRDSSARPLVDDGAVREAEQSAKSSPTVRQRSRRAPGAAGSGRRTSPPRRARRGRRKSACRTTGAVRRAEEPEGSASTLTGTSAQPSTSAPGQRRQVLDRVDARAARAGVVRQEEHARGRRRAARSTRACSGKRSSSSGQGMSSSRPAPCPGAPRWSNCRHRLEGYLDERAAPPRPSARRGSRCRRRRGRGAWCRAVRSGTSSARPPMTRRASAVIPREHRASRT